MEDFGSVPDSGLNSQQKSRIRNEFRKAYLIQDETRRNHAITGVYLRYEEMYAISRDQVRAIVQKVKDESRSSRHIPTENGRRRLEENSGQHRSSKWIRRPGV